ncbi:hypothetical protein ACOSP7_002629 [Xanthoceras sorbifolium]
MLPVTPPLLHCKQDHREHKSRYPLAVHTAAFLLLHRELGSASTGSELSRVAHWSGLHLQRTSKPARALVVALLAVHTAGLQIFSMCKRVNISPFSRYGYCNLLCCM